MKMTSVRVQEDDETHSIAPFWISVMDTVLGNVMPTQRNDTAMHLAWWESLHDTPGVRHSILSRYVSRYERACRESNRESTAHEMRLLGGSSNGENGGDMLLSAWYYLIRLMLCRLKETDAAEALLLLAYVESARFDDYNRYHQHDSLWQRSSVVSDAQLSASMRVFCDEHVSPRLQWQHVLLHGLSLSTFKRLMNDLTPSIMHLTASLMSAPEATTTHIATVKGYTDTTNALRAYETWIVPLRIYRFILHYVSAMVPTNAPSPSRTIREWPMACTIDLERLCREALQQYTTHASTVTGDGTLLVEWRAYLYGLIYATTITNTACRRHLETLNSGVVCQETTVTASSSSHLSMMITPRTLACQIQQTALPSSSSSSSNNSSRAPAVRAAFGALSAIAWSSNALRRAYAAIHKIRTRAARDNDDDDDTSSPPATRR